MNNTRLSGSKINAKIPVNNPNDYLMKPNLQPQGLKNIPIKDNFNTSQGIKSMGQIPALSTDVKLKTANLGGVSHLIKPQTIKVNLQEGRYKRLKEDGAENDGI